MPEESAPSSGKFYQCLFTLYPESQQAAIDWCEANLPCAWALHDKDVYEQKDYDKWVKKHDSPSEWQVGDIKKEHVHFVCKFCNQRYFSGIAREMSRGSGIEIPVNTIRRCNNLYKAYVYLWHRDNPEKYPYPETIVGSHEFDPPSEHEGMSQSEDEQVLKLLSAPHFSTFAEMTKWAYENNCWAAFKRSYGMWRDIFLESRCKSSGDYTSSSNLSDDAKNIPVNGATYGCGHDKINGEIFTHVVGSDCPFDS